VFAFQRRGRRDPEARNISCGWRPGLELSGRIVSVIDNDGLLIDQSESAKIKSADYCSQILVYVFGFGREVRARGLSPGPGDTIRVVCLRMLPDDFLVEIEPKAVLPQVCGAVGVAA
jgi:hypothetical protein